MQCFYAIIHTGFQTQLIKFYPKPGRFRSGYRYIFAAERLFTVLFFISAEQMQPSPSLQLSLQVNIIYLALYI